MTQEEPDLSARLRLLDADPEGGRRVRRSPAVIAAALAVSVIPAGIVYYALSRDGGDAPLLTQTSTEFQRGARPSGIWRARVPGNNRSRSQSRLKPPLPRPNHSRTRP